MVRFAAVLVTGLLPVQSLRAQSATQVDLRGMGFVTGVVARPSTSALEMYVRTDVGGVFRWEAADSRWIPLLDRDHSDKLHIESVAVDPSTAGTLYAAYGNNATGSGTGHTGILKTVDNGATWQRTGLPSSVRMGGNAQYRWTGERLQVDPRNRNYLYFGSRLDGLWVSTNGGDTWAMIDSVPKGSASSTDKAAAGVSFVAIDPRSTAVVSNPTRASTIYVGVQRSGVYRSTDGGGSFSLISGSSGPGTAATPMRGVVASDGTLYVTAWGSGGGIWRFRNGIWSNISVPASIAWYDRAWTGIAVDPANPDRILVTADGEVPKDIFISSNGGASWQGYGDSGAYPRRLTQEWPAWWPAKASNSLAGGLIFDPTNSNRAFVTSGYGFHAITDLNSTTSPANARDFMRGLEILIATRVRSLPAGARNRLLVTCQDMVGFAFTDHQTVPGEALIRGTPWAIAAGTSLSFCQSQPDHMVVVGGHVEYWGGLARITNDGGVTWRNLNPPVEKAFGGHIAMSSTNPNNLVWIPMNVSWYSGRSGPVYTTDGGATWHTAAGLPSWNDASSQIWFGANAILVPDPVNGLTFYAFYPQDQGIYRSVDGGANFTRVRSGVTSQTHLIQLKTVPGKTGELWLGNRDSGRLLMSSDGGTNMAPIPNITGLSTYTLIPGTPTTVIAHGTVNGVRGLHRSSNLGATWQQIDTQSLGLPLASLLDIEIDSRDSTKAYLAFSGRGYYHITLPGSSPNLVQNGSFENSLTSWSNWAQSTVVSSGVSGNALQVGAFAGGVGQSISGWSAGASYTLRASARLSASSDTVWVGVKGGGGQNFDQALSFNTTEFQSKSLSITLPAGTSWVQIYVWKNDGTRALATVDDISFTRN